MRVRIAIALGVLAVVLLAGVAGVLLYDGARSDRITEGVSVGDVDVGGLSVADAREVVRERVRDPARRDVIVRHRDDEFELSAGDAGVRVDVDGTVDAALEASRQGNPWSRTLRSLTGDTVDARVDPLIDWDDRAPRDFAAGVARSVDREARDARLDPGDGRLTVVDERSGLKTDTGELRRDIEAALERPRGERAIDAPVDRVAPDVTRKDLVEKTPLYLMVDRNGFRLRVYEDLDLDRTYPISVGRAGHHTPAGLYDISNKAVDPTWYVPDEPWAGDKAGETIPPGPDNPLKARWLGIEDGVGIHGTDEESSIGRRASHGCIRMRIPDVKKLYDRTPVGTPIYIG